MLFLVADLESTQKVGSIGTFLSQKRIFDGSYNPNPGFGRNPVFASGEQQTRSRELLTSDSENSGSKVPTVEWNLVFYFDPM